LTVILVVLGSVTSDLELGDGEGVRAIEGIEMQLLRSLQE